MKPKRILSLGAGVQSSTVLLLAERGNIPPLNAAIFADTGWEPSAVYHHLKWLQETVSTPIHVVSNGNIRADLSTSQIHGRAADGKRWASMPLRVVNPDGSHGLIRRQCTYEYKIRPITRCLRELAGLKPRQRPTGLHVVQLFGISWDERLRMRDPDKSWIQHDYPLVDLRWTRQRCLDWLASHGYPQPPRSACVGCPYHTNAEWASLSEAEFADAVEADRLVRDMRGMRGSAYLHQSGRALETVDLRSADERSGQLSLWPNECTGYCGD